MSTQQPDPARDTLLRLPALYDQLTARVCDKPTVNVENKRHTKLDHAALPVDAAILDFLHYPDTAGHLGLEATILGIELVSRAARGLVGVPMPRRMPGETRVAATLWLIGQHWESIHDADRWTPLAAQVMAGLGEGAQDRLDADRLRLQWEADTRIARYKLTVEDYKSLEEWTDLQVRAAVDYIDYEGRIRDSIEARYNDAASGPEGFRDWMRAELLRLQDRAETILGLIVYRARPLSDCPWCGRMTLGLSPWNEDLAVCAGCGRELGHLSDGSAEMLLRAFRDAGWSPTRMLGGAA